MVSFNFLLLFFDSFNEESREFVIRNCFIAARVSVDYFGDNSFDLLGDKAKLEIGIKVHLGILLVSPVVVYSLEFCYLVEWVLDRGDVCFPTLIGRRPGAGGVGIAGNVELVGAGVGGADADVAIAKYMLSH